MLNENAWLCLAQSMVTCINSIDMCMRTVLLQDIFSLCVVAVHTSVCVWGYI